MSAPDANTSKSTAVSKPVSHVAQIAPEKSPAPSSNKEPPFGIELPAGCSFVKVNGTATMAVCQPPREPILDKIITNVPSIALSVVALLISVWTFMYNRGKDARSRAQSIQDDFWIRKIISPISVEPFLKYTTELVAGLPTTSATASEVERYWTAQVTRISELSLSFRTLGLVDASLDTAVADKLEEFEDHFGSYCGQVQQTLAGSSGMQPDKAEASRKLFETALSILRLIEVHQRTV